MINESPTALRRGNVWLVLPDDGGVALYFDHRRVIRIAYEIARGIAFAISGVLQPPHGSYLIRLVEVDAPTRVQTFAPDFTYDILNPQATELVFTLYSSIRFETSASS